MAHAPCPICGDPYAGFHDDDCGTTVVVDRALVLPPPVVRERVRLTDDEIAALRAAAALRKARR